MRFDAHAHRFIVLLDMLAAVASRPYARDLYLRLLVLGDKSCARVPDK